MRSYLLFLAAALTPLRRFHAAMQACGHKPSPFPHPPSDFSMLHGWIATDGTHYSVKNHIAAGPRISRALFGKTLDRTVNGEYNPYDNFKYRTGAVKVSGFGKGIAIETDNGMTPAQQRVIKHAMVHHGFDRITHRVTDHGEVEYCRSGKVGDLDHVIGFNASSPLTRPRKRS